MSDLESEPTQPESSKRTHDDQDSTACPEDSEVNANPFRAKDKPKKKKVVPAEGEETTVPDGTAPPLLPTDILPDVLSKRQKKRQKQAQVVVQRKDDDIEKTIGYLTKWKENRSEWKFEKLRQICVQKNILNEKVIPDEHFDLAIEYLATTQGVARTHITKQAEESIERFEKDITDENREEILNSRQYKRAREVLQSMN